MKPSLKKNGRKNEENVYDTFTVELIFIYITPNEFERVHKRDH
jgi:hypothetical protein